jgi:hypothetical protein
MAGRFYCAEIPGATRRGNRPGHNWIGLHQIMKLIRPLLCSTLVALVISIVFFGCQTAPPAAPAWPNVSQGTVSNTTLTLNLGQTITLSGNLIIETEFDLIIEGDILFPPRSGPFNLSLISHKGKVVIGNNAKIGNGLATTSPGGQIFISGVIVDMQGRILGQRGGTPNSSGGNPATRFGAIGFRGGNITFEAVDGIRIGTKTNNGAFAIAGDGGTGESVVAFDALRSYARAGDGGPGGDVIFQVRPNSGPTRVTVMLQGKAQGGSGGSGGFAAATCAGFGQGGDAESQGGNGVDGGTVLFPSAIVDGWATSAECGNGGHGGCADASGGEGAPATLITSSQVGGTARTKGGDGGGPGVPPSVPMISGSTAVGSIGFAGSGASGNSTSGAGGDGIVRGAPNGVASATGGRNGDGKNPPVVLPGGGVPSNGLPGTPGANVFARGQP